MDNPTLYSLSYWRGQIRCYECLEPEDSVKIFGFPPGRIIYETLKTERGKISISIDTIDRKHLQKEATLASCRSGRSVL